MDLNIFVGFLAIALLIFLQTPLMLYWRLMYFVIIVNISWLPNHWTCSNQNFRSFFCINLMKIWSLLDLRMGASGEKCWKWGDSPHFLLYLITSFISYISLVGILQNRVIQPIVEHSEYPVWASRYVLLAFLWSKHLCLWELCLHSFEVFRWLTEFSLSYKFVCSCTFFFW